MTTQRMPRSLKRIAISVLRILFVSYILVLVGLYFFQERLIFIPTKLDANYHFQFGGNFSERTIESDGLKLDSILFKVPNSKGVILYLHGNAGTMAFWGEIADEMSQKTKWDVWMIDFPGFGKSDGSITSEKQLHDMAENFWAATKKEYPQAPIIVYGRSLGTGLAVKLAAAEKPAGLVLESPYFSLTDLASGMFPWVPTALLRYSIHSDEWMKQVSCPVLIFHGTEDEVIPFASGKKLSAVNPDTKFVEVAGGHHNDIGQTSEYWDGLSRWISEIH